MKYGITTVRAWNSETPEKVIHVHRANFRLVKSILFNMYLFEGMSRKDASLLSSRDAARSGPYSSVKKSVPGPFVIEWDSVPFDFISVPSYDGADFVVYKRPVF